jgi:hypothetical protein
MMSMVARMTSCSRVLVALFVAGCGAARPPCIENADAEENLELQREAAALDAALRAQALTRLEAHADLGPGQPREADGSHELEVTTIGGCNASYPVVAMTTKHEVFVVAPVLAPHATRVVAECTGNCRGACGMPMPDSRVFVHVPADAVLVEARAIRVPIDVQVTFQVAKPSPCNVP